MSKKFLWLLGPIFVLALAGCGEVDDDEDSNSSNDQSSSDDSTGGDSTTGDNTSGGSIDASNGTVGGELRLPDFESFSLSVSSAVVEEAFNVDNKEISLTASVADHFNHAVEDGTVVTFWTEYGRISPLYCETSAGSCSVSWLSSGRRPIDGLSTVVAYALGEDSFIEASSANGVYNVVGDVPSTSVGALALNEAIISAPELFFDLNYDGYNSSSFTDAGTGLTVEGDSFEDYNNNGSYDASSSLYRGLECSSAARAAGHCGQSDTIIWGSAQLVLSLASDEATLTLPTGTLNENIQYSVSVADSLGNYPPQGTSIKVESDATDFEVTYYGGNTVPAVGSASKSAHVFTFDFKDSDGAVTNTSGKITVTYKGTDYVRTFTHN